MQNGELYTLILSLAIATIVVFVGLIFTAKQATPGSSERKFAVSLIAMCFIAPVIYVAVYLVVSHLSAFLDILATPNSGVNDENLKMEITGLLARAETVALGTMAIFIPVLIALWNNFNKEFLEEIKGIDDLLEDERKITNRRTLNEVKQCREKALAEYKAVLDLGKIWRWFFYPYVVFVLIVILLATIVIYLPQIHDAYIATVCLDLIAHILLLVSICFLAIFLTQVQPTISRLRRGILDIRYLNIAEGKV